MAKNPHVVSGALAVKTRVRHIVHSLDGRIARVAGPEGLDDVQILADSQG